MRRWQLQTYLHRCRDKQLQPCRHRVARVATIEALAWHVLLAVLVSCFGTSAQPASNRAICYNTASVRLVSEVQIMTMIMLQQLATIIFTSLPKNAWISTTYKYRRYGGGMFQYLFAARYRMIVSVVSISIRH